MDPMLFIILLFLLAIALAVAETLLPTHGLLGVAGVIVSLLAVAVGFAKDRALGTGLLIATVIVTPFLAVFLLKVWAVSPIGRRLTLNGSSGTLAHEPIEVGDVGTTASALRPMGAADFGPVSVQVVGQHGRAIAAGTRVRVVSYENGVATVEPADPVA